MSKIMCVIPARYASTRFPGKMLAPLCGRPMIEHVIRRSVESGVGEVLVAADDEKVINVVKSAGFDAVMTRTDHQSGTDRIWEAVENRDCEIIINVQGDEPLIPPSVIADLGKLMADHPEIPMATVAMAVPRARMVDPNKVKVVFDADFNALYFSRSMVPYLREGGKDTPVYLHWGIYAYRREALKKFVGLPGGRLENCEKLEQLRALENGIGIKVLVVENLCSVGVDTPDDLAEAERRMKEIINGI